MGTAKRDRQRANRQLKVEQLIKVEKKAKTKRRGLQFLIGIPVLLVLAFVLVKSLSKDSTTSSASTTPGTAVAGFTYGTGACANPDGSSPVTDAFTVAPKLCIDPTKAYSAAVETNVGNFTITLDPAHAPGNVNNFVTLARYHYYDNHDCHRIIVDFVVQCGRPGDETKESSPGYTVGDEKPSRAYKLGDIAMANTGAANSGGGQFFIIDGPQGVALPQQYSLIGTVTSGYDTTVQAMAAAADPKATNGAPKTEIKIIKVTITEAAADSTATTVTNTNPATTAGTSATTAGTAAATVSTTTTGSATTTGAATTTSSATTAAK